MVTRRILCCLLGLALGLAFGATAEAGKLQAQFREKQQDLGKVRAQLREERSKARQAKEREESILEALDRLDRDLGAKRKELMRLDLSLRATELEVRRLEAEIDRLEGKIATQQRLLAERLRALYKVQTQGVLPFIFSGSDTQAMGERFRYLSNVADLDTRLIKGYTENTQRLLGQRTQLQARREELMGIKSRVDAERGAYEQEVGRKKTLLAKVRDERGSHEQMAAELEGASRKLEALVRELAARIQRERQPPAPKQTARLTPLPKLPAFEPPPAVGFGAHRGRLPWPAEGRVVATFGQQVHPRFGTRTQRNGIDIEAPDGARVTAVYGGKVLYTGLFKGYGNLIILDHGHGFYTLYAHTSEILVREGEEVGQGQVLARVGDTGSAAGPKLYFEVRYQGRPEDPQKWLR